MAMAFVSVTFPDLLSALNLLDLPDVNARLVRQGLLGVSPADLRRLAGVYSYDQSP